MWNKKSYIIKLLAVVITALVFTSCVEEPEMDQPTKPFATLRIGNFSLNVAAMDIKIANTQPVAELANLTYTNVTPYFNITSGKRRVTVTDKATGTVIYNKDVEFSSYQITSLFFLGEYSTVDTLNNFQTYQYDEGKTYVSHAPSAGKINLYFLYLVLPALSPATDPMVVDLVDATAGRDSLVGIDIESKDFIGFGNAAAGGRKFKVTKANAASTVLATDSTNFVAGKNYFIFMAGNPNNDTMVIRSADPLAPRGK